MRNGCGRRSLILDCRVEGPRGAKPWKSTSVSECRRVGGRRVSSSSWPALPWPSAAVSGWGCIAVITIIIMVAVAVGGGEAHLGAGGRGASRQV